MKLFSILFSLSILLHTSCNTPPKELEPTITNNDPALVGKWVRKRKYHLELYANGIGSKEKGVQVTDDIMRFRDARVNWVTFNNNFLLIGADEDLIGFSYQIRNDTLFLRQAGDKLEFFVRVKDPVEDPVEEEKSN